MSPGLPFSFDIETIPQRPYWPTPEPEPDEAGARALWEPPSAYIVEEFWLRRKFEEMQVADPKGNVWLDGDFEAIVNEAIRECSAPLTLTGQIPACHATTAHIVSVSFGKMFNPETMEDIEVQEQIAQMDDFLAERAEPQEEGQDYEIMSKPGLEELSDSEIIRIEKKVLQRTVQLLEWGAQKGMTFVSFNGKGFDLPMIRWRCVVLDVTPPKLNWYEMLYPYRHKEHIDLRLLFSDGDRRAKGTLSTWADAMGLESEESGAKVFQWAKDGDWDEIRRYGAQEMETLIRMFLRCQEAF